MAIISNLDREFLIEINRMYKSGYYFISHYLPILVYYCLIVQIILIVQKE